MRRALLLAATVGVVTGAVALAAFSPGRYGGQTSKGGEVSFSASSKAVTSFKFAVELRCSNGKTASNVTTVSRIGVRNGRFSMNVPAVSGAISGSKASGTVAQTIAQLPVGKNCRSGTVKWTARQGAKPGLACTATGSFNGGDLQVDMGCDGEFDGFDVHIPRPATRADTSTAHLRCLVGTSGPNDADQSPIASCSAQDGVRLRSGRVLIRFSTNADCSDASKATVTVGRVGATADYGPFAVKTAGC